MKKILLLAVATVLTAGCAQEIGEIDRTQSNILDKKDLEGEWYFKRTVVDAQYLSTYSFIGDQAPIPAAERGVFEMQEENLYFYRTYEFTRNSQLIGLKADVDTPYLTWLPGDDAVFTPDPNQSRDLKYAEGDVLSDEDGKEVSCAGNTINGGGGMHEFCEYKTANGLARCGHDAGTALKDRTAADARCVQPTKFIFRGAPLAVFPIDSHFDVVYEYNPTTGEKTNVLVENSSDRFWYERDFMRVNWGDSQITNFQFSLSTMTDNVVTTLFEGDEAPEGEELRMFRDENGGVEYFDYLSSYVMSGPTWFNEYYNDWVPYCGFYPWVFGRFFECFSEQFEMRTSFMKVDPDDDYVPQDYDDFLLDKFGYYRQERLNFDDYYETTYGVAIRLISRYDLWDIHPQKDDGTLDYSQMEPQPIVYYLSEGYPRDLVPEAVELGRQWAKPFNEVVEFYKGEGSVPAGGMFVVCENNNGTAQEALAQGLPIAETDPSVCKDMDYVKKHGDLRYSFLVSVNPPAMNGLLGYGPFSADPLTGKILSASAHIYTANVLRYANRAADMVEAMVGFKDYKTMASGFDITAEDYPESIAVNPNPPPASVAEAQMRVHDMVGEQVHQRITNTGLEKTDIDFTSMRMNMIKGDPELEKMLILPEYRALFRDFSGYFGIGMNDQQVDEMSLRSWANHKGVQARRKLVNEYGRKTMFMVEFIDAALIAHAKKWKTKFDGGICTAVIDAMDAGEELAFKPENFDLVKDQCTAEEAGKQRNPEAQPRITFYSEYNPSLPAPGDTCMYVDQGDPDVSGYYWVNTCTVEKLGKQLANKIQYTERRDQLEYWTPSPWYADTKNDQVARSQAMVRAAGEALRAEMVLEFKKGIFMSVAIHEVGHNLGLRHNFEGSTDAMNFPKEYWEAKVALAADGETWLPLDLWTEESQFQQEKSIREYQYSSIMDYGAKFNDLYHGIGMYDSAAIKFGYGGIVEVFDEAPNLDGWDKYLQDPSDEDPESVPSIALDSDLLERLFKRVHYSQLPNVFGTPEKLYERKNVLYSDVKGAKCLTDADCGGGDVCRKQLDAAYCSPLELVEVPYRFCSDEYAGTMPLCDRWYQGSDEYEIVRNSVNDYWWYWMWYGRWRGSTFFDTYYYDNYNGRIRSRFQAMKRQFQWWAIQYARYNQNDWWEKKFGIPWHEDFNGGLAGSMATDEAFNTLMQVFAIPDGGGLGWPNQYGYNPENDRYELRTDYNRDILQNRFFLEENYGRFGSRPMYASWMLVGNDAFPVSGGAIFDRLHAFTALTDPTTDFLNIDEFPDQQKHLISFFTFFPDRMISLLGGLTTHREENYAACVVEDEQGKAIYVKLRERRNLNDPNFCSNGHFLEPEPTDYSFETTWFRLPMLAAYYGMSLMINAYDRRFMDTTRVFLKGHEDELELPEDAEVAEFADPFTGKIYMAYRMGSDKTFHTAHYLVDRANMLFNKFDSLEALQEAYEKGDAGYGPNDLKKIVGLLELIRGLHKQYDYTSTGPYAVTPDDAEGF